MVGDPVEKGLNELSGTESAKTIEALKRIRLSATMLEVGFKSDNLSEVIQCQIELEGLAAQLEAELRKAASRGSSPSWTGSSRRSPAPREAAPVPPGKSPPCRADPHPISGRTPAS